ncbi:hypothetical protein [Allocoleopsis franciscana]|uniref:Uncharacterized protein n=1 Tax=Allocoleopsis franciscana PCC 7113 TaxID=1173027 RepID=K9WJM5_9CYAN|nr:hypothetical protein [Allocoleopsis franciscana]AFZ20398.1 hypothetical protein Mic7113_4725 [Allocoleopsis franciscana PCC 7113]
MANSIAPATSLQAAQRKDQITDTETYSKGVLGPVYFTLSKLDVKGSSVAPADQHQSQYIVASDEKFTISVQIDFNASPLAKLLMCLGTTISVDFGFEGFGAAPEVDVKASIVTVKDQLIYTISKELTPEQAKLTPGLYEIGATVTVGPGTHACDQYVYGYGYIEEILLQVYPAM